MDKETLKTFLGNKVKVSDWRHKVPVGLSSMFVYWKTGKIFKDHRGRDYVCYEVNDFTSELFETRGLTQPNSSFILFNKSILRKIIQRTGYESVQDFGLLILRRDFGTRKTYNCLVNKECNDTKTEKNLILNNNTKSLYNLFNSTPKPSGWR